MPVDPPEPGRRFATTRYELVRQIARGGMAEVYLARDTKLDRRVAVKVLFPELSVDRNFVERFRREAQAAANLSHPNIVSIYDWGEAGGTYFIVMEYVDGQPLSALIHNEAPLLADWAADIGTDVAAALGFAHRHGVVHRDVKPGNVLITPDGTVKVTDFGIAQSASNAENLTQTGAVMGTATYFSPEQAQGLGVDARSDVYSLGVVLYEMVTGRPPFAGDGPMAVAYKHVHDPLPPPRSINPGLQPAFEGILLRTLAKDPRQRYESAEELRADLLRFRQGRPVHAPTAAALGSSAVAPAGVGAGIGAGLAAGSGAGGLAAGSSGPPDGSTTVTPPGIVPSGPPPRGPGPATQVVAATEPARSTTWIYAVVLVVLLSALAVVLYLLGRSLGYFGAASGTSSLSSTAVVPGDLVGKTTAAARAELTAAGLSTKEVDSANNAPAGQVFNVTPPGGTQLKRAGEVELDVSTGPQTAPFQTVPNVVGQTYQNGGNLLQAANFVVAAPQTLPSDTEPYGIILAQDPAANSQAHQGATVTLTVSSGKAPVPVPDVTGKALADATYALGQDGFKYSTVREPSASLPAGTVTRTSPAPGTPAAKGTVVTVYVSSGPATVNVPSVVGMTSADANAALTAKGFQVSVTTVAVTDPAEDGRVQSQNPPGGSSANTGSTVTVQVGKLGA
jgi:beta-lactam-binding protein with PASTA domain/tRNA A-37 threonylcarbamoyl transferase component Bud32